MWQLKMEAILVQDGSDMALQGKEKISEKMTDEEFDSLDKKARSSIILNLSDDVLRKVASKTTVKGMREKLKSLTELFSTYDPVEGGVVLVDNNVACKIVGTGEDGVLEVFRGGLVVMKARKSETLYTPLGSTITGQKSVGVGKSSPANPFRGQSSDGVPKSSLLNPFPCENSAGVKKSSSPENPFSNENSAGVRKLSPENSFSGKKYAGVAAPVTDQWSIQTPEKPIPNRVARSLLFSLKDLRSSYEAPNT
ncbi:hypothetical protein FXO37_14816 [Capsicum annuum]|nr:hypothetical protein FXO37_14816 [Capsicum annuum]